MEYIVLIVLGYFFLKICGKLLSKIFSPSSVALWLVVLFLWMFLDWFWLGAIIIVCRYVVVPWAKYQERHPKRSQRESGSSTNWNSIILWMIPVFWPFLIAKMFFSGKQYKPSMDEYDYEQFLKGNGK